MTATNTSLAETTQSGAAPLAAGFADPVHDAQGCFRAVKIGVLDDPSGFQSHGSIWTAEAQPWHHVDTDLPAWDGNPEPPSHS